MGHHKVKFQEKYATSLSSDIQKGNFSSSSWNDILAHNRYTNIVCTIVSLLYMHVSIDTSNNSVLEKFKTGSILIL